MDKTFIKSTSVPLCDPRASYLMLQDQIDKTISRVLHSGYYVMGPEVEAFEAEWAEYCGRRYAVMVSTGTAALMLAIKAFKRHRFDLIEKTDEVLTTPFTFWATTQAIIEADMCPRFIDIDPITGNIPDQDFEDTLALMVPIYGRPGKWIGTNIIEDRAHAHSSNFGPSRPAVACYSFYPTKNLGAFGEGGMVVTDTKDVAEYVREARSYGERGRFHYYLTTGNHRPHELQAAILRVKLPFLNVWNNRRRRIASMYIEGLKEIDKVFITVPPDDPGHVYHIFAILAPDRDRLAEWLKRNNIGTAVRYPLCCHQQPAYFRPNESYPNAERWAAENLTLPIDPGMSDDQVEFVIDRILYYYQEGEGSQQ